METIEDDLLQHSLDFMGRARAASKPFFLWHNTTRMHVFTHLSDRWRDKTKYGLYADGMAELDWVVGELLNKVEELGIADNTIVIFTTDNGAEKFSWPDGGTSPFRGEKGLGWEGGFRVPFVMRWPGKIPAGQVLNGIFSLEDVVPTVMAAAGVPDVKEQLLTGYKGGDKTYKVHWTVTISCPTSPVKAMNHLAMSSSTMARPTSTPFVPTTGKSIFKSRTIGSQGKS
jgi:arylsulfatase